MTLNTWFKSDTGHRKCKEDSESEQAVTLSFLVHVLYLLLLTHFCLYQKHVEVLYPAEPEPGGHPLSSSFNIPLPHVPLQATAVREDKLLVAVLPGLPTAAEFFLLPDKQLTEGKPEKTAAHLDQVQTNGSSCFVC